MTYSAASAETFDVAIHCRVCDVPTDLTLRFAAVDAWHAGTLVQDAFPDLSADERELLVSRTCGPCWDRMESLFD